MINYSFIIPHHNIPNLLQRCLDSIPQREDVEIIVVDDCSDKTKVDFEHFPGSDRCDVQCVFLRDNGGPGVSKNKGLEYANGRWVLFPDSDDFFNSDLLANLDNYLDSDSDVIVFKTTSCYSEDVLKTAKRDYYNRYIDEYKNGSLDSRRMLFLSCSSWGKMIKRSTLINNSIVFDPQMRYEDTLWVSKLAVISTKISASEMKLYCVTYREDSLMKTDFHNDSDYLLWYDTDKRKRAYLYQNGFLEYIPSLDIERLTWARKKLSLNGFILFFKKSLQELSKKSISSEDRRFIVRHPYLYFMLVLTKIVHE